MDALNDNIQHIEQIILFGSFAKGEATQTSDIDIFIEVKKEGKKKASVIEKMVHEAIEQFYTSREATLFKLHGIENRISVIVGQFEDFPELHRSIMSTGIVLWGPYQAKTKASGMKHHAIFYWERISRGRGALLNRLYGFHSKGKNYPGLLAQVGGRRIGKSCILVPIIHQADILKLFRKYKVHAFELEVFTD
jgi:hypothetical protein